jgi:hypothetical protein
MLAITDAFDEAVVKAREEVLDNLIGTHRGHCTVVDTKLDEAGRIITVLECGCGYIFEAALKVPVMRCPPCVKARASRVAR